MPFAMIFRPLLALLVPLLGLLAAPRAASAQLGSGTDIITGTVAGPDGRPLAGARVEALSVETQTRRGRTTGSDGRYTILFPDGGGQYHLTIRFLGMAPVQRTIAREADEDRFVVNVQMTANPTQLGPVVVSAQRAPARGERPEPGASERVLNGEQLTRLPLDPTDLAALAALSPGVVALTPSDSTAAGFSVAGQRPDLNNVTVDGATFGGSVPTEAVRQTRVITSTYDVARGQFTGGQIASTTR
ncbi:MAG TPA: carboxypeptidase-like regulatory domain-containing protein, partial [Gemmatimonadaceae bacterium]|nr:carboxypeptidase-like regulatory domain-containing protein [Gemmatimonadaceae bacterium]